ncbi:unnamed protein product [Amoebophrya sp. A25]|nr:unnamed protein product [Amoebophrya sp. A25]|eukprot:GSA25T00002179001.1
MRAGGVPVVPEPVIGSSDVTVDDPQENPSRGGALTRKQEQENRLIRRFLRSRLDELSIRNGIPFSSVQETYGTPFLFLAVEELRARGHDSAWMPARVLETCADSAPAAEVAEVETGTGAIVFPQSTVSSSSSLFSTCTRRRQTNKTAKAENYALAQQALLWMEDYPAASILQLQSVRFLNSRCASCGQDRNFRELLFKRGVLKHLHQAWRTAAASIVAYCSPSFLSKTTETLDPVRTAKKDGKAEKEERNEENLELSETETNNREATLLESIASASHREEKPATSSPSTDQQNLQHAASCVKVAKKIIARKRSAGASQRCAGEILKLLLYLAQEDHLAYLILRTRQSDDSDQQQQQNFSQLGNRATTRVLDFAALDHDGQNYDRNIVNNVNSHSTNQNRVPSTSQLSRLGLTTDSFRSRVGSRVARHPAAWLADIIAVVLSPPEPRLTGRLSSPEQNPDEDSPLSAVVSSAQKLLGASSTAETSSTAVQYKAAAIALFCKLASIERLMTKSTSWQQHSVTLLPT